MFCWVCKHLVKCSVFSWALQRGEEELRRLIGRDVRCLNFIQKGQLTSFAGMSKEGHSNIEIYYLIHDFDDSFQNFRTNGQLFLDTFKTTKGKSISPSSAPSDLLGARGESCRDWRRYSLQWNLKNVSQRSLSHVMWWFSPPVIRTARTLVMRG